MTDDNFENRHHDSTDGLPPGWAIRTWDKSYTPVYLMKDGVIVADQGSFKFNSVAHGRKSQQIVDGIIKDRNAFRAAMRQRQEAESAAERAAQQKQAEVAAMIALGLLK